MEDLKVEQGVIVDEISDEDYVVQLKEALGIKSTESKDGLVMIYPPIEFSDEELTVLSNTDEWKEGYKIGAFLGGMNTVLINSGMDVITAGAIVANEHAMRVNIETQKIINEGLKLQGLAVKKTQI